MLNWKRFTEQLEAFKRTPALTAEGQQAVQRIIDVASMKDYELRLCAVVARYLDAVFIITERESAVIAEEGRFVKQLDSEILRATPLSEHVGAPDLLQARGSNKRIVDEAERAIAKFPERLAALMREFVPLSGGKVPDFPGALYDFVQEIERYRERCEAKGSAGEPPEVPPEVASIAQRIRSGEVSMNMISVPAAISMHWAMDKSDFPERLNKTEACRYLEVVHGVRIGGTALRDRAIANKDLKSGKWYLRDALATAAAADEFDHGNKGRKIRS